MSRREIGFNDNADCEFIWTNRSGPPRLLRHRWMGCIKASEHAEGRVHPTQKPVVLMEKLLTYLKIPNGATILDPYCGSGTTGVAALRRGYGFIGIEKEATYVDVARSRLAEAAATPPLFSV